MKNSLITSALFIAAVLLVSCQEEGTHKKFNGEKSPNAISFRLGSKQTKADAELEIKPLEAQRTVKSLGFIDETNELVLEESIVSLDDCQYEPQTKGTLVYTENVIDQGSFSAVAYTYSGTSLGSSPALSEAEFVYDSEKDSWRHVYPSDPWAASDEYMFFMKMNASDVTPTYSLNADGKGKISFDYTSPHSTDGKQDAASQKDILFASTPLTKSQNKKGESSVLFYHALSAVKFRIGNAKDEGTVITKVTISGLKSSGHCDLTPYYGGGSWNTTSNPYGQAVDGSKSAECAVWTFDSNDGTSSFSQAFAATDTVSFVKPDSGTRFADSFYAAAADRNLNKADASLTFWFIPQELNENVKLTVDYTFGGNDYSVTLDFSGMGQGYQMKPGSTYYNEYPELRAGELRTYTLRTSEVNVTITDEVDDKVKDNVTVTNTGSAKAYIRAAIIGNWVDKNGTIINQVWDPSEDGEFEWEDALGQELSKDYITTETNMDASDLGAAYFANNWILAPDGYYYYKYQVLAGEDTIGKLFTSYTVNSVENEANHNIRNAHLEMQIMVQAIVATKLSGEAGNDSYVDGWYTGFIVNEVEE